MRVFLILLCVTFAVSSSTIIELEIQAKWAKEKISDHGFDITTLTSLVFEVKACGFARLQMTPFDNINPFYRFIVNDTATPNGGHRKCVYDSNGKTNCFETENLNLESCCNKYQTYWTRITETGEVMVGKGHLPGCDVLHVFQNDEPFKLQEIILQSKEPSQWKLRREESDVTSQDSCPTNTSTDATTAVSMQLSTGTESSSNIFHDSTTTPPTSTTAMTTTAADVPRSNSNVCRESVSLMILILVCLRFLHFYL